MRVLNRQLAIIDVLVVGGVSLAYVLLEALQIPKRWSFLAMGLSLAVYAVYFGRRRSESWHALGFRIDNLREALFPTGAMTVLAGVGLILVAAQRGELAWGRGVLVLLALYPAWALVQQFAFQGLLHRQLAVLVPSPPLQVLITAAAFAFVHIGNPLLAALTFLAGVVWSLIYRRWPNLWLLAGSHTILAALAYPLVLADAPLSRF